MQEIENKFEVVYQHPRIVSKKFRKVSHPELEIFLYLSNFSKDVSQQTDWQTYKKFESYGTSVQRSQEYIQNSLGRYFSKDVSQIMDWQTYKKL